MTTTALEGKVHDFLAQKRIAVAGVSRDNSHHPAGNLIYRRLKETGHDVFPVNPHLQTFEGDRCYPDVPSIPGGVDGVVIITRPLPSTRDQRDRRRLPDDVRRQRRHRTHVHAVDLESQWRTTDVGRCSHEPAARRCIALDRHRRCRVARVVRDGRGMA
jgi:hypothetical protein